MGSNLLVFNHVILFHMPKLFQILIAPDSFKGSLSAEKIAGIMYQEFKRSKLPVQIYSMPLADGGEGSLEAIQCTRKFQSVKCLVLNPHLKETEAFYLSDSQDKTAYIELAQASGLGLIHGRNDIMRASTYGTGELIKKAIENGATKIVLFLGGSASCDAGLGIADALGVKFYNSSKVQINVSVENMDQISGFDISSSLLKDGRIELLLAVDVNNPFFGSNGASYIYSPQKGANPQQVKLLDDRLRHLAYVIQAQTGIDLQEVPGSGAAGGAAGGLHAFFAAKIIKGTEFIFRLIGLEEQIKQADLIISGEGKIDKQSLNHKLLFGLSRLTSKYKKRLWAVCGYFDGDQQLKNDLFIDRIFPLARSKDEVQGSIEHVRERIEEKCKEIIESVYPFLG
jgi:glycerate 2-kinase